MIDKRQLLFEVSWEVCNKVGGIYTVIKSKIDEVKRHFGDNYYLIGPMFDNNPEFHPEESEEAAKITERLKNAGIIALVGRWKEDGNTKVILVKYKDMLDQSKLFFQLWEDFKVDSMTGKWDYIEPVLFSTMAAKVIEEMSLLYDDYDVIAQFHEWMTGAGLLYLDKKVPNVATVFTTHATILGRSMAGSGVDIYNALKNVDARSEAIKYNIIAKHSMEAASAREADCFTTVSEITGTEAKYLLSVEPDIILPNGFNVKKIPDYATNKKFYKENREKLLNFASRFLKKGITDKNAILISTSGRYEYHNKGIDLIVDALDEIRKSQHLLNKEIVAFLFIIGGYVDMSRERKSEEQLANEAIQRYSMISTHPLWDPYHDPIVNECQKKNMQNNPGDKVNIIYVPVYLNGRDGTLNMEYYETLAGCDLTIYPSYYEPWGYTPLESTAYSVPTVVSDITGFGKWLISNNLKSSGIKIIQRYGVGFNDSVNELKNFIMTFMEEDHETRESMKLSVRKIAQHAEWSILFKNYLKAFEFAREERNGRLSGKEKSKVLKSKELLFKGTSSASPRMRQFSIKSSIPKELERLSDLAYNMWWSWNPDAAELFKSLNPELFGELSNNPIFLLEIVDIEKLQEAILDKEYMGLYERVIKKFDNYLTNTKPLINMKSISRERPVAYFSMEFGFHECMQLYSGGLGILSGDHIKSASDINIPLVGVGLLYKNGYFKQRITRNGDQIDEYIVNDFFRMPLKEVKKKFGEKLIISIDLPGRTLHARVWVAEIGRIPVYFLDTDVHENSVSDREITAKLYKGTKRIRIEQEILLGIGGVRLLENELRIYPSVYHINEGHSAFLILERMINHIKKHNLDIDCARELVKTSTVFTTHTPVPAGNETFDMSLIENYFENYIRSLNINLTLKEFSDMGHKPTADPASPFDMTVLALKHSYKRNGVSRLHGVISRKMWAELWGRVLVEEIPITHITNGVHVPTWLRREMRRLFEKHALGNMNEDLLKREELKKIYSIPDEAIWKTHQELKEKLFNLVEANITHNWEKEGESPHLLNKFFTCLNPASLTIGFGRRFATYKRALLFFKNYDRLRKIVMSEKTPVQFIFAGKAHPDDKEAQGLIKEIVGISKKEEFLGKIIFLEDYDIQISRKLIAGVDVWLNNPRRPLEASGTSGQKAGINGVLNLSILDGWWDEGYDGKNGWAIGEAREYMNLETQDIIDSNSLYDIIENKIIPAYYTRNAQGTPVKWIKMMKESMYSVTAEYNTHRMLKDYIEKMYEPAAQKYLEISADNFKNVKEIADWKKSIKARFSTISIRNIVINGIDSDNVNLNDEITVYLEVDKGRLLKEELRAELLLVQDKRGHNISYIEEKIVFKYNGDIKHIPMMPVEEYDNTVKFMCKYLAEKPGKFSYGIRVIPQHEGVDDIVDLNLVEWG